MEISASLSFLAPVASALYSFFGTDPVLRTVQVVLGAVATGVVFLVFYTTRDVLIRSRSLLFQLGAILTVALLPGAGFLLYLLVRPSRTLKEREIESRLIELLAHLQEEDAEEKSASTIEKAMTLTGKSKKVSEKKDTPALAPTSA